MLEQLSMQSYRSFLMLFVILLHASAADSGVLIQQRAGHLLAEAKGIKSPFFRY